MAKKLRPLPSVGYYWVPASIDSSQSLVRIGHKPHDNYKLGIHPKKINNRVYYKVGTPKNDFVVTMSTLKAVPEKFPNVDYPMMDLLKEMEFSLYGVPDTPKNDTLVAAKIREKIRKVSYIIQDSGGFQLATGVADFVDPKAVAKSHSRWADSGVSLDIPGSSISNYDLVIASAKMLAANSETIQKNMTAPVRLLNVCHGSTLKIRHDYLKTVLKNPLDSLCIGGLRAPAAMAYNEFDRTSPTVFASHILLGMIMGEKHYEHFHILGVSSDWQMALMSLIAQVRQKVVTSDSATYKLSGFAGIHMGYGESEGSAQRLARADHRFITTRCPCPICRIVGYDLVYGRNIASVSMIHNAYAIHERAVTFNAIAREKVTDEERVKMILASVVGRKTLTHKWRANFRAAVDLIMKTTKVDQLRMAGKQTMGSLFDLPAPPKKAEVKFAEAIQKYEKYHKQKFLP